MSIQNAYNEWSRTYDTDRNLTRDLDQQVMVEILANQHFDSILEIGCGTGKKAVFNHGEGAMEITAFVHHISDFFECCFGKWLETRKTQ